MMTNKEKQAVYDAIKLVREGNTVDCMIDGIVYILSPFDEDGSGQTVLCKYHGRKIGVVMISWKDAGPNPKLDGYKSGSFIPRKNIYALAEVKK